jgi:hypothetical protein
MTLPKEQEILLEKIKASVSETEKIIGPINDKIKYLEKFLKECNAGVEVRIKILDKFYLCFGKIRPKLKGKKKWCIYVFQDKTTRSFILGDITPLLECDPKIKIKMSKHLPDLLIAIRDRLEELSELASK